MRILRLEILVEELSAERALTVLIPRIAPGVDFEIRTFNGKPDLLRNLPKRFAGYVRYARGAGLGVVVLADRDAENCRELKDRLEDSARVVGLPTLSSGVGDAIVANRIACEELEAIAAAAPTLFSPNAFRDGVRRLVGGEH